MMRTVAEYESLEGADALTKAERALIAAVRAGKHCFLQDDPEAVPGADDHPAHTIRADLLTLLIVGGSKDCGLSPFGVSLVGAYIKGCLRLAHLSAKGDTFVAYCRFESNPNIRYANFQHLDFSGSHFPGLNAQGLSVSSNVYLRSVQSDGTIDLNGARIQGQLVFDGAILNGSGAKSLFAQGIFIGSDLLLRNIEAYGFVDLNGSKVEGQFSADSSKFQVQEGAAFSAEGVSVLGSGVFNSCQFVGCAVFRDARFKSQVSLNMSKFLVQSGVALEMQGVEFGNSLFIRNSYFLGAASIKGAKIESNLEFDGSELTSDSERSINMQSIRVGNNAFLRGVIVVGAIDFSMARIDGYFDLSGSRFEATSRFAIIAQSINVLGVLVWKKVAVVSGLVSFVSSQVGDLWDDLEDWPKDLNLDGFTYRRLFGTTTRAKDRLPWLAAGSYWQSEFSPQPYTQLAKVLREMGHDREARVVLIERERRLAVQLEGEMRGELKTARNGEGGDVGRAWIRLRGTQGWHWATGRIAGYGYAPHYALQWAFWAVLVGMMVYFIGYRSGAMVPNSAIILTSTDWAAAYSTDRLRPAWYWAGETAQHFETFYALPYALDVFLPVVDLGQHSAWTQSTATWVGWALRLFTWALQGAGYLITGLGLAAITGWIQKDRG